MECRRCPYRERRQSIGTGRFNFGMSIDYCGMLVDLGVPAKNAICMLLKSCPADKPDLDEVKSVDAEKL